MARLPIPGSDKGNWGQILNEYLSAAHNADGTLKANSVNGATIANGSIPESKLDSAVQSKLNSGGGSQGATGAQGPAGPAGAQGAPGAAGSPGAVGATGAQGPAGSAGSQGPAGAQGATGPAGTGVAILGSLSNQSELPPTGNNGDAYLIAGSLWVWTGSDWEDAGNIQGPAGNQGATGAAGAAGAQGATGPQGPQGPPGTGGGGGSSYTFRNITANATAADGDFIFVDSTSGAITITLPAPVASGYVRVKRLNAPGNGVQVVPPGGAVIDGVGVGSHTLNDQYQSNDFLSNGTNWYRV